MARWCIREPQHHDVAVLPNGNILMIASKYKTLALAGGGFYSNWRAGFTNVAAGDRYISFWNQSIPALGTLVGDNIFTLVCEDVTPAPYNQPPYPPAGDAATATCAVTGIAP